ncbi:MAG TPA: protein phosphatase 2C domain-containing protein [Anaerolineae bacterium]
MATPQLVWYADKDKGPRADNQDAVYVTDMSDVAHRNAKGVLLVLCDGVGGEKGGQRASALASETAFKAYYADNTPPPQALRNAIDAAHQAVRTAAAADSSVKNMASTIVTLAIIGDKLHHAHVGDSRAYLLRGDTLSHLTKDHNWVAEQVAQGLMTAQEGRVSTKRNIITRSLGASANHSPDVTAEPITLQPGDRLMICSDGLHGAVLDEQIKAILLANPQPQRAVAALIQSAKDNHTTDNISSIVFNYGSAAAVAAALPIGLIGAVAGIVILLAVAVAVIGSISGGDTGGTPNPVVVPATRRAARRATSVAQGTPYSELPTDTVEEATADASLPTVTPDMRISPTPAPIVATSIPVVATIAVPTSAPVTQPPQATSQPTDLPKPGNTSQPLPTPGPTSGPVATTAVPVATIAVTIPPVVTLAPTSAPTTAPTTAPTPVPTQKPTHAPPHP